MKFEISRKKTYSYFWKNLFKSFLISCFTLILLMWYKGLMEMDGVLNFFLLIIICSWFLTFALPLIYLFVRHFIFSSKSFLEIKKNHYSYVSKNNKIDFSISDIEKIELWLTPPNYDKRTDWLQIGPYHFTRFYLKTKKTFDISCLTFDQTEILFSKELITKNKSNFPVPQLKI